MTGSRDGDFVGDLAASAVLPVLAGCRCGNREEGELNGVTRSGTDRYVPDGHRTEPIHDRDLRASLMAAALGPWMGAPLPPAGRPPSVVTGAVADAGRR